MGHSSQKTKPFSLNGKLGEEKKGSEKEKPLNLLNQHMDSLKEQTHQLNYIISEIKNVVSIQHSRKGNVSESG